MEKLCGTLKNVNCVETEWLYPSACVLPKLLFITPAVDIFLLCLKLLNSLRFLHAILEDLALVFPSQLRHF